VKNEHPVKIPALDRLPAWSVSKLRSFYEELHQRPSPPRASADFLRGNIAWTLQAIDQGKSPPTLRQALIKRLNGRSSGTSSLTQVGTRLIREWQGKTYQVTVLDKGYLWQDARYNSLSRIAEKITGTRWSGPRFFGLKDASNG